MQTSTLRSIKPQLKDFGIKNPKTGEPLLGVNKEACLAKAAKVLEKLR